MPAGAAAVALNAGAAAGRGQAAAGGGAVCNAAEVVEGLLAGLAAGGGYQGVDNLLSCWIDDVLDLVSGDLWLMRLLRGIAVLM